MRVGVVQFYDKGKGVCYEVLDRRGDEKELTKENRVRKVPEWRQVAAMERAINTIH